MSTLSILLVGASGAWGQPLVNEFIKRKHEFKRIAILARSESQLSKFDGIKREGIDVVVGSFLDAKSYEGFDTVFLLVGNPVLRLQPAMIEAAVQAGVTHIYPSEWNSDVDNPAIANMRYFRDKMATRAHLDAVAKTNPKLQYTIFITGIFTEWTLLAGWDHDKKQATIYGDSKNEIGSTSIPDIAKATVQSLNIPFKADQPSIFPGRRTIRIQGQRQPYEKLVADLLSARVGVKYDIEYRDVSEALANGEKARQNGDEAGEMFWSISTLPASGNGVADGVEGVKLNNDWFDIKWETQRQTLERMWGGK